ncbi:MULTISPECIES: GNAT family N-acetyltransferase/peptidase C39 family protein [unclassified Mesorhizobium]|uniref:GNAT family N-acetyltransferase/peptidase C39 family protein n=1 Tax=unclassified Mesorhizobium TaxID=325217 RepID=UPI00112EACEE|nr:MULTISPECIES: GNAT family N-acetyltransferase/peptidase C39 family protein [unclassified Mesorhizobium]MCA0026287.1 GNAT family N-acetyltransferase/peptidase C39 family protein [Mesorhizobium sp. B263B1A]TPJ96466.1 GNAT family N-acetyltransferase [Mesorhizobium sp. B2-5-12]TPK29328.1 GNAT family N-acetyltransferase [Mesorhizobium sp. B2-5-6]TPN39856.1 GNAT family N-acetyltransferase [Mesorhizobium sp. B1-1-6]TPN50469.1 GNAT family N-acetyltransferase [Mesorhizobium sp. B1-1-4]
MPAEIRTARATDVDDLAAIEKAVFSSDRISRRSFRQFIERETAETLVAERDGRVAGYAIVLFRKGSGVARLYSIATSPFFGALGIGRRLLTAAEEAAFEHDRMMLRLEVREDNARAIGIYEGAGYRKIGREPDYYEDGATALRYEKTLRGELPAATSVPFYQQTCEFTCGPCCLMMAMGNFDHDFVPDPVREIRLWREATTVFMMSGPGGCEPFGLAVAGYESGLAAEIYVSFYGALFLQSVRSADKRRVMELAQVDFRRRAELYGIPVNYRSFTIDDIRAAIAKGKLVLVLISGFLMFGKKVPHWVLAIGDDGDHILIHDPWVEDERQETILDAANIPVPYGIFMNMAQFGRDGLRAAITLGKR